MAGEEKVTDMASSSSLTWLLGAQDPEMNEIEALLRECGQRVCYALRPDGQRVTPREAYQLSSEQLADVEGDVVFVECDAPCDNVIRIDHHRPGDPGFGRPPAEAVAASSIGQVIAQLARIGALPTSWRALDASQPLPAVGSIFALPDGDYGVAVGEWIYAVIPTHYCVVGAADHCLAHAYAGRVPGIWPASVLRWRAICAETRPHSPVSRDVFLAAFYATQDALEAAPCVDVSEHGDPGSVRCCISCGAPHADRGPCGHCGSTEHMIRDLRSVGHLDELPDVASYCGAAYITQIADRDGRSKLVIGGAATPEAVRAFMETWGPAQGLTGIYGDPERGFAGGYVP